MTATTQEELKRREFQMRLHGTNASSCNNSVNVHNIEEAYVIRNLCNLITYQIITFNSVTHLCTGVQTYTSAQDYSRIQTYTQCTRLHSDTNLHTVHKTTVGYKLTHSAQDYSRIQTYTQFTRLQSDTNLHQCTRLHTGSSEPQPQHLVLDTICGSIIRIQPNTPEDGHIDARNL